MAHKSLLVTCGSTLLVTASLSVGLLATSPARRVDRGPSLLQQPDSEAPEVSLGVGQVVRGEPVFLSLLVFQEGVKVVKTTSEIALATVMVTFEGMERHPDQDPSLQIDASIVPETKGTAREILRVEVASGRGPLPEGTLVKLKFRVSPDTPAGVIDLEHTAQALTVDGKTITAAARNGQLKVAEIAVFSCFFYMH